MALVGKMTMARPYPTIGEIRAAHSWKRDYERYLLLSRFLFRPIGFWATWGAIRMGLTTEAVSWLSGIVGLAGCIVLVSGPEWVLPVGFGLLFFFNLLDCVDGSIARVMKTENPYGRFLDSICGYPIDIGFWGVVGAMAFQHPQLLHWQNPFGYGPSFWLVVGVLSSFLLFLVGYLEQTFDALLRKDWDKLEGAGGKDADRREGRRAVIRAINTNFRVRESHYFFLLFAYWTKTIDLLLILYFIYYLSFNIILLVVYSRRGKRIRNLYC